MWQEGREEVMRRKGKEKKRKERKGKERKGKEKDKDKENTFIQKNLNDNKLYYVSIVTKKSNIKRRRHFFIY